MTGSVRRTVAGHDAAFPTPCLGTLPVRLWRPLPVRKSITRTETGNRMTSRLGLGGGVPEIPQPAGPALSRSDAHAVESVLKPTISDRSTLTTGRPTWRTSGTRATSCVVSVLRAGSTRGGKVSPSSGVPFEPKCVGAIPFLTRNCPSLTSFIVHMNLRRPRSRKRGV